MNHGPEEEQKMEKYLRKRMRGDGDTEVVVVVVVVVEEKKDTKENNNMKT
jgi:hypothetical protein